MNPLSMYLISTRTICRLVLLLLLILLYYESGHVLSSPPPLIIFDENNAILLVITRSICYTVRDVPLDTNTETVLSADAAAMSQIYDV